MRLRSRARQRVHREAASGECGSYHSPDYERAEWAMRSVQLPDTGVITSALGFGCADMFRLPRRGDRKRLLEVAFESGISHFDVAPMYGLGRAEHELGVLARGRREQVTIATKFGIIPTAIATTIGRVQGPARRMLNARPAVRASLQGAAAGPRSGRSGAVLYRGSGYGAGAARRSLERSLKALGTDYIDLFLLHDPGVGDVRAEDDVLVFLEDRRRAGVIRAWGVAGEREATFGAIRVLAAGHPVRQIRDDIFSRLASDERATDDAQISYGVLGRALPRIVATISSSPDLAELWHSNYDGSDALASQVAESLMRDASRANLAGIILFNSVRAERIRSMARSFHERAGSDEETIDVLVRRAAELTLQSPGKESRSC
jgi:D-threo-aldose 1-dehydrogenase